MKKEIPQIDVPEDWVVGTDITRELLSMYTNYPVRLKCEVFVLCMGGEVEATLNINKVKVQSCEAILLPPGSIFQIHRVEGDLKIYVLAFSEEFMKRCSHTQAVLDAIHLTFRHPVISMPESGAELLEDFFRLMLRIYDRFDEKRRKEVAMNLYQDMNTCIRMLYKEWKGEEKNTVSKNEQLCRNFARLVVRNYAQMRNVTWYAEQLQVTHAYLCSTVKRIMGTTCMEVISSMVIMDAKSQLKLTDLSIQAIADSLNFANMSFFGKYFKRHVGMSPLEYRNNG
ncbi:MAG: AraC family transcriptional regulator [Bacteroides sp.]|nr:AraC family transcriptional regulator [Bacteroides sp.]